jgi:hypothetical protein
MEELIFKLLNEEKSDDYILNILSKRFKYSMPSLRQSLSLYKGNFAQRNKKTYKIDQYRNDEFVKTITASNSKRFPMLDVKGIYLWIQKNCDIRDCFSYVIRDN